MFVRLIRTVGLRDIGVILVQALQGALRPVRGCVLYAQGACSRGYKFRSREGAGPRSLGVGERSKCS
jgi:hypothetical protein